MPRRPKMSLGRRQFQSAMIYIIRSAHTASSAGLLGIRASRGNENPHSQYAVLAVQRVPLRSDMKDTTILALDFPIFGHLITPPLSLYRSSQSTPSLNNKTLCC